MRYFRFVASFVLTSALIFILVISISAAPITTQLSIEYACLYYKPVSSGGSGVYDYVVPTYYDDYASFSLTENGSTVSELPLSSIGITFYPPNGNIEFEHGYIYTFDFVFRMNKLDLPPDDYKLNFGVSNDDMSLTAPLCDVVFNYTKRGVYTEFSATCVVNVKDNLDFSYIGYEKDLYYYLEIVGGWSGDLELRSYQQTVTKSVGEDAYYQASLDAINNLPQSEYDYIYNSMPDSEGEIETIKGEFIDIMAIFDTDIAQLLNHLKTDEARPCVYLPEVNIPILKIKVWDSQVMYIDTYLNNMDVNIMNRINVMVIFVRMVLFTTLVTYTLYKILRIEWWY